MKYDAAIIGSGFAGVSAARAFVARSPGSTVLLINGEDRRPYKRTKISKNVATGYDTDSFALFEPSWFAENAIDLISSRVTGIDKEKQTIVLAEGSEIGWKTLIVASGASPKRCFGSETFTVRTAHDGELLVHALQKCRTSAVIGGGVLAVEVAEQLHLAGVPVTLFSRSKLLMPRELNEHTSRWLGSIYADQGIACRLGASVDAVTKHDGGYTVQLEDGSWEFDCVVECTGSLPNTHLARQANLDTQTGILVNETLQTSHPAIFAAGDCTELRGGRVSHLWHQAEDQGRCAGRNAAALLQNRELEHFANRPRRLKCEVFGTYVFSLNAHLRPNLETFETYESESIYQEFGFESDVLRSVIMTGDKARAKEYETAVWERWSQEQVKNALAIQS